MKKYLIQVIGNKFKQNRNDLQNFEILIEPHNRENLTEDRKAELVDVEMGDW
jgi:hypothetical protein